jgi:hypothetical protein
MPTAWLWSIGNIDGLGSKHKKIISIEAQLIQKE